jgi:hypothetical protein
MRKFTNFISATICGVALSVGSASSAVAAATADRIVETLHLVKDAKGVIESMITTHEITEWYVPPDGKPAKALIAMTLRDEKGTRWMNNMALTPFKERARTIRVTLHDVKNADDAKKVKFMIKGDAKKEVAKPLGVEVGFGMPDENRAERPFGPGESVKVNTPGGDDKAYYLVQRLEGVEKTLFMRENPNAWVSIEIID